MTGIGLLAWIVALLCVTMRGERIAYRVLYHAEEPPDGATVGRMLAALASNAGHVSLIWRFSPGMPTDSPVRPRVMQGDLPEDDCGPLAGKTKACDEEAPCPDDGACSPMNISLYIVAPTSARRALEGMIPRLLPGIWAEHCREPEPFRPLSTGWQVRAWRWDTPSGGNGSLADPFACGLHLSELLADIGASAGRHTVVSESEVRLILRPRGWSAIVTALYRPPARRPNPAARDSVTQADDASGTSQCMHPETHSPFLMPLLLAWPFGPHKSRRVSTRGYVGLSAALMSALAARYPLWERTRILRARQKYTEQRQPDSALPAGIGASVPEGSMSARCLRFPASTGRSLSLDSIAAGELSPPSEYILPPVRSQVLVLGRATKDGRPIGVPALRSPHSAAPRSTSAVNSDTNTITNATIPALATHEHVRLTLHPMLADHLLVTGGTDAWRRDVAGSVVSQGLEMGMTVVSIDGGSPPDEPPAAARKRSRLLSADMKPLNSGSSSSSHGHAGGGGAGNADPLSPLVLRFGHSALAKRVAQIDLDNPAGSVRPNMLYVPAPPWLPSVQGESLAVSLALQTGLSAQMRFLEAVNVTGMDTGMSLGVGVGLTDAGFADVSAAESGEGTLTTAPGIPIVETWLTVLLLRHHRARLRLAARGISPPTGAFGRPEPTDDRQSRSSADRPLPSCPDLPSLMFVLEQPETLLSLLEREWGAWSDREWIGLIQEKGGTDGEEAIRVVRSAMERAAYVASMDLNDLFLFGAAVRGQLSRLLSHPAMLRILSGPHVSLAELLDNGIVKMLRVNLSGAYRTVAPPRTNDDLARKHYGLYLLWSLWAASGQRAALREHRHEAGRTHADPVLLTVHGAGSWFGSGSPLSDRSVLAELGSERSGVAVAATVSGLHHMPSYRGIACESFGSLIIGPAPVTDLDAPPIVLGLADTEMRFLRDEMQTLVARAMTVDDAQISSTASDDQHPLSNQGWRVPDADRLLGVLRRIDEGTSLVVTSAPGGRTVICTAPVGSGVADEVRNLWSQSR